jgi:NitT/TauT family transport system substrate-binding protein
MLNNWSLGLLVAAAALAAACGPTASARTAPAVATAQPAPAAAAPAAPAAPAASAPQAAAPQAAAPAAQPVAAPARATVRAGGVNGLIDRAYFTGIERGYYAEQGIDLEIENFVGSLEMVPLLATGRLEVGHGSTSPGFYNALLAGVPVKVVSDVTVIHPVKEGIKNAVFFTVRRDGPVRSPPDIVGRKVAVNNVGTLTHIQLARMLEFYGLNINDVDPTSVPFPEMALALSNGAVDGAMMIEPFLTQAESRGLATPLFDVGIASPGHVGTSLFYGPDFIRAQPEVGRRFLVAYTKALRFLEDAMVKGINREEAVSYYIKYTPVKDPALYDRMGNSYNETNARVSTAAMESDQDFYVRLGVQKEKIDPRTIVDTSFSEYVLSVLGPYQE